MDQKEIDALARHHTRAVTAIGQNFTALSKHVIATRGSWTQLSGPEVLEALLAIDVLERDTAQHVARAAHFGRALPDIIRYFTPAQRNIVSAVEASLHRLDTDGTIKRLDELARVARDGSDLQLILHIARAIAEDGKDVLYAPGAMRELTDMDRTETSAATASSVAGDALTDDVGGAVIGGVAGAVTTWWAGSGPGAAGGALGGAIMFSGKVLWEAGKKWWDGTHHGPTDPNGPIGGGGLPDDIPVA